MKILLFLTIWMFSCGIGYAQLRSAAHSTSPTFFQSLKEKFEVCLPIQLALKSNLLSDFAAIPHISAEVGIYKGITISGSYHNMWLRNKVRTRWYRFEGSEAEVSYYINKEEVPFKGHHVGLYGQMQTWDFTLNGRGNLGERWAYGCGVSYGYILPVIKNLNIDFEVGLGYLGGKRHRYTPEDGHRVWDSVKSFHWVGPTKLEATVQWIMDFKAWRAKGE